MKSAFKQGFSSITQRFDTEMAGPHNNNVPFWQTWLEPPAGTMKHTREDCEWADAHNMEKANLEWTEGPAKLATLSRVDRSYAYGGYAHVDAVDPAFHVHGLHKHQTPAWQEVQAAKGKGKRKAPETRTL